MGQHRSQLVWFRLLYMLFSRYVFVNSLERLRVAGRPGSPANTASRRDSAADESSTADFVSPPESPEPPELTEPPDGEAQEGIAT